MMATAPSKTADDDALTYEETHVHSVYESIASHFSSTRYKPWPVVDAFLRELTPGSIGLDVGCGNGKYLNVNKDVFIVGSDRSSNLIALAAQHQTSQPQFNGTNPNRSNYNADVLIADTLSLPHPNHTFDFAICIAVIHHLSSRQRRIAAIRGILKTLKLNPALNQLDQSHPPSCGQPETTPAHHASLATPSPAAHTQSQIENQVRGLAPKPKLGSAPAPKPKPGSAPAPKPKPGSATAAAAAVPAETTNRSSASATEQPPRSSATAAAVPDPSFPGSGDASASANTNTNTIADLRTQSPSSAVLGRVRDPVERAQTQQDFADPTVSVLQQQQQQLAGLVNEGTLYADDVEGSEGIPCADAVGDAGVGLGPGGRESQAGRNGRDGLVVEGQRGAGSNLRPLSSARGSAGGDGYGYADGNGGSTSGDNGGNGGGVGGDVSDRVVASSSASLSLQQQQEDQGQASSSTSGMVRRSGGGGDSCTKVGQALLFVWALEQQGSRRGWKEGDEQDVLVPWVLKARGMQSKVKKHKQKQKQQQKTTTQNELPVGHTQVETQTQGEGEGEGAEENRAERNTGGEEKDVEVVEDEDEDNRDEKHEKQHKVKDDDGEKVFGRFYHLYAHHELESECEAAGAVVVRSGYDRDNWWVVVEPAPEPGPTRGPAPGLED